METLMEYKDDVMIVRLKGELDQHYASLLRSDIDNQVAQKGIHRIVFDFSNIGFMDSSGLGLIMGRYALMQKLGGEFCIENPSERALKIFELAGLGRIIKIKE